MRTIKENCFTKAANSRIPIAPIANQVVKITASRFLSLIHHNINAQPPNNLNLRVRFLAWGTKNAGTYIRIDTKLALEDETLYRDLRDSNSLAQRATTKPLRASLCRSGDTLPPGATNFCRRDLILKLILSTYGSSAQAQVVCSISVTKLMTLRILTAGTILHQLAIPAAC